jgi:hypothetical protein
MEKKLLWLTTSAACLCLLNQGCDPGGDGVIRIGPPPGPPELSLIDSMEDGDGIIDEVEGRQGPWYTYNDETGNQDPLQGEHCPPKYLERANPTKYGRSRFAMHTSGTGFTGWGAGVGVDLNNELGGPGKRLYDASAYSGVGFWIRLGGDAHSVRLKVLDAQTTPPGDGGTCTAATGCQNSFGYLMNDLTKEWQYREISWEDLVQENWGERFPTVQESKLLSIQFQFPKVVPFDVWIDDLVLVRR